MSKGCCSCGGREPVVIQCGTATPGGSSGGDDTSVSPPPSDGPSLPTAPPCQIVAVRFHSIRVREAAGVEFLGVEAPETWDLILTANDQSVSVTIEARDNADESIDEEVDVELPSPSTTISVRSSGHARSLGGEFFEDTLPATENSHGASDNWGIDSQVQLDAGDRDRTYTVFYSIKCQIARTSSVISRTQAINVVQEALSQVASSKSVPEDVALTMFIRRMESAGYQLKDIHPDILVWEGPHDIHRSVQRLLGRRRKAGSQSHEHVEEHLNEPQEDDSSQGDA
jgi:hypothetical protein